MEKLKIMATIKSYTDLEQSKKLAKILPLESADMYYSGNEYPKPITKYHITYANVLYGSYDIHYFDIYGYVPCWSLAALLDILTEQDFVIKTIGNEFNIDIPIRHCKIWFSSLLDAAFEMVCWLFENKKI